MTVVWYVIWYWSVRRHSRDRWLDNDPGTGVAERLSRTRRCRWRRRWGVLSLVHLLSHVAWLWLFGTRKPSCCWQTRVTWKHAQYILIVTHSGGMPSNINEIYTSMKSTFSGLQFCCWQCGSIYIRLAVVAFQMYEIARNSKKIRTYSSTRSSKVINLDANRKLISTFLLVINSNFGRISHHFRDIAAQS